MSIPAPVIRSDGSVNPGEAGVVRALVAGLLAMGAGQEDVGLISPFNAQVRVCGGRRWVFHQWLYHSLLL